MSVMSVHIDDNKRKALKIIASAEGKSMGIIISELITKYIEDKKNTLRNFSEGDDLKELMKMSEFSFSEWDNDEDEVYNSL